MDMEIERLDHHGIVAGIIKDLKLIEMIDERIPTHKDENITCGEAIAGMVISGLGFSDRPLSLTPQFFENCPIAYLLERPEIKAEHFNHFKLGRALEDVFKYGADQLFMAISALVCAQENIDQRVNHLDTTTFSVHGKFENEYAEEAVALNYGYSRDKRPDLKQVVLEMMVSEDGGVPLFSLCWDGNTNDSEIFKTRAKALIESFKASDEKRYLIGDSKLYSEAIRAYLKDFLFVTRVPATLKAHDEIANLALNEGNWEAIDDENFAQTYQQGEENWVVVFSNQAQERAKNKQGKAIEKEAQKLRKALKKLSSKAFACKEDAHRDAQALIKESKYHQLSGLEVYESEKYEKAGRPSKQSEKVFEGWKVKANLILDEQNVASSDLEKSCYILATNDLELKAKDVVSLYKQQIVVEKGFRFLKDPKFFTSAFFLKKPERIQGLLMVMTLALLVYSVAERRLRRELAKQGETLPNQIKKETPTPTLRWLFQCMSGVNRVLLDLGDENKQVHFQGLNELRNKIIALFGPPVVRYYQIQQGTCSM